MGEDKEIIHITETQDIKNLIVGGVDLTEYLYSYTMESTPDMKEISLSFRLPDDKVRIQVGSEKEKSTKLCESKSCTFNKDGSFTIGS